MTHDGQLTGLQVGMFLGGLLMALVPITISIGIGIWALRQRPRPVQSAARRGSTQQENT